MSGEHAWVGMFLDDLVCAAADDELVSVGGTPRLDEAREPVCRALVYFDAARSPCMCSWSWDGDLCWSPFSHSVLHVM